MGAVLLTVYSPPWIGAFLLAGAVALSIVGVAANLGAAKGASRFRGVLLNVTPIALFLALGILGSFLPYD